MGCHGRGCELDPSHTVLEETKRGLDLLILSYPRRKPSITANIHRPPICGIPKMLEVFGAARQAQPIARARNLSLSRSDKGFGYALGIDAAPEAIRP